VLQCERADLVVLRQQGRDAVVARLGVAASLERLTECSDPRGLTEAYDKLQESQRRVEELYARWAELEAKVAK